MTARILLTALALFVFCSSIVDALSPSGQGDKSMNPLMPAAIDNTQYIDANKILMFVTNYGSYGRDLAGVFGNDYGTYFPFTSVADIVSGINVTSPLYAAGLWLGGKVGGQVRVTVAEYSSEYVPGPMAGGTFQTDRPDFKVYKLYSDSLASNPNSDYLNWPVAQGAPTNDDGSPKMLGDQLLWCVYNDADPNAHDNDAGYTAPLGVEIQQTIWASGQLGISENAVGLRFLMLNKGSNAISDMYFSLWFDPDLGGAGDDLVGCDTIKQIMFCYNGDNDDTQYGTAPPAMGARLVAGPIVPSPGDTAYFNGDYRAGFRNLRMASFNMYVNGIDPTSNEETYNYMQGLRADGSPYTYNGNPTKFVYSGDPVTRVGDLDTTPADRRMMASFGPFNFLPGDTQQLEVLLGIGEGGDRLSSITVLKFLLEAQNPPPPPTCCSGLRGNVTDDTAERIDIADLVYLVQYAFGNYPEPPCPDEADVDRNLKVDIVDIAWLVAYMFHDGPPPAPCSWL